jgi:hypothetical protein
MTIKDFFTIPSVRFGVHVLLVTGLMLNVYQFYRISSVQKDIDSGQSLLNQLKDENKDASGTEGYFNSPLYQDKYNKQESYTSNGELVLDTSTAESNNTTVKSDFQVVQTKTEKKNWEKWNAFFFQRTTK